MDHIKNDSSNVRKAVWIRLSWLRLRTFFLRSPGISGLADKLPASQRELG
jgi:hypothetical protein